jgi:ketosteroid isomerase-like protein
VIYKGQAVSRPRRFTNVYVQQNGQWRLAVHHVTPIAE